MMEKKLSQTVVIYLSMAIVCLVGSSFIDLYLWFEVGYLVPSWAIASMFIAIAILLVVIVKLIKTKGL